MTMPGRVVSNIRSKVGERTERIRNKPGRIAEKRLPELNQLNIGRGRAVAGVGAGILTILEDTIGVPFGATIDIVNTEPTEDGMLYTVNVNAPTEGIAEARSFIDTGTGFSSYLTEEYNIESMEIVGKRPLRDTYQVDIEVIM